MFEKQFVTGPFGHATVEYLSPLCMEPPNQRSFLNDDQAILLQCLSLRVVKQLLVSRGSQGIDVSHICRSVYAQCASKIVNPTDCSQHGSASLLSCAVSLDIASMGLPDSDRDCSARLFTPSMLRLFHVCMSLSAAEKPCRVWDAVEAAGFCVRREGLLDEIARALCLLARDDRPDVAGSFAAAAVSAGIVGALVGVQLDPAKGYGELSPVGVRYAAMFVRMCVVGQPERTMALCSALVPALARILRTQYLSAASDWLRAGPDALAGTVADIVDSFHAPFTRSPASYD